ncbi:MAG TPA: thiamine pyrophosphate-dependent enzyme, partial [Solirubrobacteraceae bacterium]|nr:thiamine pyrophosphate-dependent enzyme [Solirubrobacteraceae bacterium]
CRAFWTALSGRPGPVHLNFTLRDPLVPDGPLPPDDSGRPGGRPWLTRPAIVPQPPGGVVEALGREVAARPRGVNVAGRSERDPGLPGAVAAFAARAGYPVLADPLSGARRGPSAVAHYDALLRDAGFAAAHAPDLVLRVGDLPTSKPLRQWLAGLDPDALQVRIDPEEAWQDPDGVTGTLVAADPAATLRALAAGREHARGPRVGGVALSFMGGRSEVPASDEDWAAGWQAADRDAAGAITAALGDELSEPRVAAELGAALPAQATCFVASSMPVRDVETFWPARDDPPRALSNRGANGIDGTVAAAFGAAAHGPTVLLIGDVALAYDLGALVCARRLDLHLTIVAVDNDGGGIFHFLPIAAEGEDFERHVATPHGLDLEAAARLYGLHHERPGTPEAFVAALRRGLTTPGARLIEVSTNREDNVAVHRRVWAAVAAALT